MKICYYCSVTKLCPTLCDPMDCKTPGFPSFTASQSLLKFTSTESVMPSNCHPLLLLPSIFPRIRVVFPMSWLFTRGSQSIGALASASVLPMSIQGWFPLGLTGLISLLSKGLSRVFSSTTVQKHQFFGYQTYKLWDRRRGSHQRCLSRCVWKM